MSAHQKRVLVVDDEPQVRRLLARMLNKWGYPVQQVDSGAAALVAMEADPADIVLCDVGMPGMDGVSLAQQLHVRWPGTAIIMSTGHDDPNTVHTSRKAGAVAYVTKPFIPYLVRDALERVG